MKVAAVMPAKGRPAQTLECARRLLATAGVDDAAWQLVIFCDDDHKLYEHLRTGLYGKRVIINGIRHRLGYWRALSQGSSFVPDATHLVNLANDLLPGAGWLAKMLEHVADHGDGVAAFNDGINVDGSAAHFCANIDVLRRWYPATLVPLCYDHMFGDAEIATRADQEYCFSRAPWSVLYHNHVYIGNTLDDIYKLGHAHAYADQALYERRRANGWRD